MTDVNESNRGRGGGVEPVLCHSVNGLEKYVPGGRDLAVTLLLIIYLHASLT